MHSVESQPSFSSFGKQLVYVYKRGFWAFFGKWSCSSQANRQFFCLGFFHELLPRTTVEALLMMTISEVPHQYNRKDSVLCYIDVGKIT